MGTKPMSKKRPKQSYPSVIFLGKQPEYRKPFTAKIVRVDLTEDDQPRHLTMLKDGEALEADKNYLLAYFPMEETKVEGSE